MKRIFRLGLSAVWLAALLAVLPSCLRDEDEMPLELNFYKSIDGSQIMQGGELEVIIQASKRCQVTMLIDSTVFSVRDVEESAGYVLPTNAVGYHRMDVDASCDGEDTQTCSWVYEVLKNEDSAK